MIAGRMGLRSTDRIVRLRTAQLEDAQKATSVFATYRQGGATGVRSRDCRESGGMSVGAV
jgi:hypothetical protein